MPIYLIPIVDRIVRWRGGYGSRTWLIEGKMRRFEAYNYVGEHPEKILTFIEKYFTHRESHS